MLSPGEHRVGSAMVDIIGGQHGDAAMAVFGVVPREERPAKSDGRVDAGETAGESRVVLQGLELRLGERIVIGDLGAAQRARDPEVGEQLRGTLACHRCPTVGVQREHLWRHALLVAGFLNQTAGEDGVFPVRHHPTHDVAAEDVEQDVEVEIRPLLRSQQLRNIPRPALIRPRGHKFGFAVLRVLALVAPLSYRLGRSQDPIHGALGAQVCAVIKQGSHHFSGRAVNEALRGEHFNNVLALGYAQCPGGRWTGLLVPGSRTPATVEGCS